MYSSTLSLTWALDCGGWSTPRPVRFIPGKDPVLFVEDAWWTPQGRSGRLREMSTTGFDRRTVQHVGNHVEGIGGWLGHGVSDSEGLCWIPS